MSRRMLVNNEHEETLEVVQVARDYKCSYAEAVRQIQANKGSRAFAEVMFIQQWTQQAGQVYQA
ncbi:MAG: hypothetical protein Q8936_01855 [Bacillota bacterium]|nr:hypothetical protein [Bacillota bacterium]